MRPTAALGCSGNRSLVSVTCTTTRLGLESENTSNSVVFGKPMTKRVRCGLVGSAAVVVAGAAPAVELGRPKQGVADVP